MSELITRRTFLKATGAAALAVAASGMLAGCGEGYGATPGNPTLPTLDTSNYKGLPSCSVGMGAFSGTFESNSVYESDGCRHYYLYTALGFQSVDTSFSLSKNQITFTFKNGKISKRTARSLISFIGVIWAIVCAAMGSSVAGWASIVCIVCFMSGVQLVCLGVIGEYIGKIYMETKARPRYIISERTWAPYERKYHG